jgi:hypothetical protein
MANVEHRTGRVTSGDVRCSTVLSSSCRVLITTNDGKFQAGGSRRDAYRSID